MNALQAVLVYGWCDTSKDALSNSCPPPIELVIQTPGIVPSLAVMEIWKPGLLPTEPAIRRGAHVIPVEFGTMLLFESGYAVTVYSDSNVRDAVIESLRLANAPMVHATSSGADGSDLSFVSELSSRPMLPATE